MYVATLNIPITKPLHFSPHFPSGRWRTTAVVSPRAVAAVETTNSCLYEVLRVEPTATLTEIKTAYRSLAKVCHPDLSMTSPDGGDFIEIHNAYETLSDPAARAVYDLSLVGNTNKMRRRASVAYSGRGWFLPRRRWETDQCW